MGSVHNWPMHLFGLFSAVLGARRREHFGGLTGPRDEQPSAPKCNDLCAIQQTIQLQGMTR